MQVGEADPKIPRRAPGQAHQKLWISTVRKQPRQLVTGRHTDAFRNWYIRPVFDRVRSVFVMPNLRPFWAQRP